MKQSSKTQYRQQVLKKKSTLDCGIKILNMLF